MAGPPKKPSWVSWVLVPIVWAIGIGITVVMILPAIARIKGLEDAFDRMAVPGAQEMTFTEPGTYTVFHEYQSQLDGKTYHQSPEGVSIELKITRKADGAPVPTSTGIHSTYTVGGRAGTSIATFPVEQPGAYVIEGQADHETVIAISKGAMGKVFGVVGLICGAVAVAGAAFIVGLVLLIVAIVRSVRYGRWARANPSGGAPA